MFIDNSRQFDVVVYHEFHIEVLKVNSIYGEFGPYSDHSQLNVKSFIVNSEFYLELKSLTLILMK